MVKTCCAFGWKSISIRFHAIPKKPETTREMGLKIEPISCRHLLSIMPAPQKLKVVTYIKSAVSLFRHQRTKEMENFSGLNAVVHILQTVGRVSIRIIIGFSDTGQVPTAYRLNF